jgi:hypothetical protein
VPTLVGERVLLPQAPQHGEALGETGAAVGGVDAVPGELMGSVALAEAGVDAPVGQHIEGGDVLGHPDGVVEREEQEVEADPDPLGDGGDGGGDRNDRGRVAVVGEVVLREPDGVVPQLLGAADQAELVGVDLGERPAPLGRVPERELDTDVEPVVEHAALPSPLSPPGGGRAAPCDPWGLWHTPTYPRRSARHGSTWRLS